MSTPLANITDQFCALSALISRHNISHVFDGDEEILKGASDDYKLLVRSGLSKYLNCLELAEREKADFTNSAQLTRAALRELRVKLPEGVFERIGKDDHIEIYTDSLIPAFKSANFWGMSSYRLDELYSKPYEQLFGRDPFYQAAVKKGAQRIFSGQAEIIESPVPEHIAWELHGPFKRKIKYNFFSAVYDQSGQLVGGLVSCKITPLEN